MIQYGRELKDDLLRIAGKSDYHICFNNSVFTSHGNKESKMMEKMICPKKKLKILIYLFIIIENH